MKLKLNWPVDREGYVIEKETPPEPLPGNASEEEKREWQERAATYSALKSTIIGAGAFERIVRKGGQLDRATDAMKIPGLYNRLAKTLPTEKRAIEFASTFGLLTNPDSESLQTFFGLRDAVERLVAMKPQRGKRGNWDGLSDWMEKHGKSIRLHAILDSENGGSPQPFFQPQTLFDAIVLQFFEDVTTRAKLRLCARPGCGEWFKYGPGTSPPRRETAKFCSPKCQATGHYLKMREGKT